MDMKAAEDKNGKVHLAPVRGSEVNGHSVAYKLMEHFAPQSAPKDVLPESAIFCHICVLNSVLERAGNRCAEQHGLTMPQWLALGCIGHTGQEGITHSLLGQRLMLSKAPITGVVDRLERDGHVLRTADKTDRRVSRIRITPKGEETWLHVRADLRSCASEYCADLSSEEQQTLLSLLGRLLNAAANADPLMVNIEG
jgi:MarR family 2-MHQ and catechol resistance regulon transcriptional repressor